jgi:DNA-binding NarL/FixJ family response regulator
MDHSGVVIYLISPAALDRQAYRLLLEQELHLTIGVDSDFTPVSVWAAMRANPDLALVIVDAATPEVRDAVQMIPRLRKRTRILVAGASVDDRVLKDWGRCGIDGYVVKDAGLDELKAAIDAVLTNGMYFSAGVREAIERGRDSTNGLEALSRREMELLPLLAHGMTLREAASRMTVSYKTADSYRTSLLRKLGVRDRVELARLAIREHIVDP